MRGKDPRCRSMTIVPVGIVDLLRKRGGAARIFDGEVKAAGLYVSILQTVNLRESPVSKLVRNIPIVDSIEKLLAFYELQSTPMAKMRVAVKRSSLRMC